MKIQITESQLRTIIGEGKQVGILYHFTDLKSALSILSNNTVNGSMTSVVDDIRGEKAQQRNSISFTRHKSFAGGTPIIVMKSLSVRFEIDGNKLSNHYKIVPYNFFNKSKMKGWLNSTFIMHELFGPPLSQNEFEERIYMDKIPNISKYIIGITIDINRELRKRDTDYKFEKSVDGKLPQEEIDNIISDLNTLKNMYPDVKVINIPGNLGV